VALPKAVKSHDETTLSSLFPSSPLHTERAAENSRSGGGGQAEQPKPMWVAFVVPNGANQRVSPASAEMVFGQTQVGPMMFPPNTRLLEIIMAKMERYKKIQRFKEKKHRSQQQTIRYKARQQIAFGKSRYNGKFISREKLHKISDLELIEESEAAVIRMMKESSHKIFKIHKD